MSNVSDNNLDFTQVKVDVPMHLVLSVYKIRLLWNQKIQCILDFQVRVLEFFFNKGTGLPNVEMKDNLPVSCNDSN